MARETPVIAKPDLGLGKEILATIDVSFPVRVCGLAVQDPAVSSFKGESSLFLKVVCIIVDTAPLAMLQEEGRQTSSSSIGPRRGEDSAVSLIHPQYQLLSLKLLEALLPFFLRERGSHLSSSS